VNFFVNLVIFAERPVASLADNLAGNAGSETVVCYQLYTALLSDWRVSDSLPLAYLCERTCELDNGAILHCKELEDWLRALGLWYCKKLGIGESWLHCRKVQKGF